MPDRQSIAMHNFAGPSIIGTSGNLNLTANKKGGKQTNETEYNVMQSIVEPHGLMDLINDSSKTLE